MEKAVDNSAAQTHRKFLTAYQEDPHSLRHKLAEQLRTTVQLHIDEVAQAH